MFLEAPDVMVRQVYVSEEFDTKERPAVLEKLDELSKKDSVIIETVQADVFRKMSDTQTPQGILCVLERPKYCLEDILKPEGLYLLLEDVQDPGNLGTMFRTAEGAGVDGIIMSNGTVDLFNPKTIRSTMGSVYRMPFVYTTDLIGVVESLGKMGICSYAAHLDGEAFYDEFDYTKGTAFLIGNEGNGLSKACADAADRYLKIPMEGHLESLNAAVAAAILMYETLRQRRKK